MNRLKGYRILVTGAASGIGQATVLRLLDGPSGRRGRRRGRAGNDRRQRGGDAGVRGRLPHHRNRDPYRRRHARVTPG